MNELAVMKIKCDSLKAPGTERLFIWGGEVDKQWADQAGHAPRVGVRAQWSPGAAVAKVSGGTFFRSQVVPPQQAAPQL